MKILIVLSIILSAVGYSECVSPEMRLHMMNMMVEKCAATEGASKEDIELTMAKKSPITHKGKCLQACLAETGGFLDELKLDVEKIIALAGMAYDFDETIISATRLLANSCKDVTGPERCEAIFNIFECAKKVAKENNLPETIVT